MGRAAAQGPRRGGELIVGTQADVATLDPHYTGDVPSGMVQLHMYETLIALDRNNRYAPGLAESWFWARDGLSLTIRLRQGVTFHDGVPFDAAAVKANLDRMMDPEARTLARSLFATVDRVDTPDSRTVVLRLKEPTGALIANLASNRAAMVSPDAIRRFGRDLSRNVVGTGPFVLEEWRPKERIVVRANDKYWGGRPNLDRIIFRPAPNTAARIAMLEAGDAHVVAPITPQDVDRLRRNPNLDVITVFGGDNMHMPLVTLHAPLRDKRVRQALNYAVDKEAIARVIFRGFAKPLTDSPLAPATWGYQDVGNFYPFDRPKARQLMQEAGYDKGFRMTIIAPDGRYINDRQVAEAVASYLKSLGIEVDLQIYEWGTYVGKLLSARTDPLPDFWAALITFAVGTMDADQGMVIFRGDNWPPNGFNFAFYRNPQVDALLARGRSAVEPRDRLAAYREAQRLVMEDAPAIFLVAYQYMGAVNKKVKGVWLMPIGAVMAKGAWLE
ncbi:MAG: ABC transporter substrate-binding protein [Armatimonadota bacterium]|nr:ABC transporter substrate-binding protein [Armatimonadota bacterium]MDR7519480.1 ABC transporter substrate-binding protein [Armatimonadota bacterium]MDR7549055.1 ABC transporter substrate-binding protein [Armatimonadota bacterium]